MCLAGGQLKDTNTLQDHLMQRKEGVPRPTGPPDPTMAPRDAPHVCNSLNTIERLQLPGSGQVLASGELGMKSLPLRCPDSSAPAEHVWSTAHSPRVCLAHNPAAQPTLGSG